MIKKFNSLYVTLFGIGKIKIAPGTIASFFTSLILFYLFHFLNISKEIILISLVLIFIYSFVAVSSYIKEKEDKDPKEIVIDEVVGQSIPLYLYEISHGGYKNEQEAVFFYIYIFIIFRFFDIKKPFPISYIDKNHKNSFGVIFDDVIAGIYTVLALIIFMLIKLKFF